MFRLLADNVVLRAHGTSALVSIHAESCLERPEETNLLAREKSNGQIFTYLTVRPSAVRITAGEEIPCDPDTVFVKAYGRSSELWRQLVELSIISPTPEESFVVDNMGSCVHAVRLLG